MKDNITIRKAVQEDLPMLLRFEQEIIAAERPYDETIKNQNVHYYDLASMLDDPQTEIVVAEITNEIIATGYARIMEAKPYLKHTRYAYLGFMFVHPLHRGQNINGKIVEALSRFALAQGVTELRLDVYADNEPAVRAYEKAGFTKHLIEMRKGI